MIQYGKPLSQQNRLDDGLLHLMNKSISIDEIDLAANTSRIENSDVNIQPFNFQNVNPSVDQSQSQLYQEPETPNLNDPPNNNHVLMKEFYDDTHTLINSDRLVISKNESQILNDLSKSYIYQQDNQSKKSKKSQNLQDSTLLHKLYAKQVSKPILEEKQAIEELSNEEEGNNNQDDDDDEDDIQDYTNFDWSAFKCNYKDVNQLKKESLPINQIMNRVPSSDKIWKKQQSSKKANRKN